MGDVVSLQTEAYALAIWHSLPDHIQRAVIELADGAPMSDLGGSDARELAEAGVLERDGSSLQWTPMGHLIVGIVGDRGVPCA